MGPYDQWTGDFANKVYDVLVVYCGASTHDDSRLSFVHLQINEVCTEYRFGGSLGFGGKLWRVNERIDVNCYSEDETPDRTKAIKQANKALTLLMKPEAKEDNVRQFIHAKEAWYAESALRDKDILDDVFFGVYHKNGGTSGEMSVKWVPLVGEAVAELNCFSDAVVQLVLFKEVWETIANRFNNKNFTPKQFIEVLKDCGFEDNTPRKNPYERKA